MTLTISSDRKLDGDDDYEPNYDDYDEDNFSDTFSDLGVDDQDEADADFGEPAYKKRKRAVTTTSKPRNMDSITNARIKNEGGEAFILDDDSTSLTQKQTSRAPGAFERRKWTSSFLADNVLIASRPWRKG